MKTDNIKYMSIKEFVEEGFLQEVNRQFFHPLGLALEVTIDFPKNTSDEDIKKYKKDASKYPGAVYKLGRIWDYRNDEEGNFFGDGMIDPDKIKRIMDLKESKIEVRKSNKHFDTDENGIQIC